MFQYDVLELDKFTHSLAPCPLLADPSGYKPDLENLGTDEEAREYWLNCFEKGIDLVCFYVFMFSRISLTGTNIKWVLQVLILPGRINSRVAHFPIWCDERTSMQGATLSKSSSEAASKL